MPLTFVKRAVSPIHFESAPTLPEDILCPGSEEEESSEEHRQKRRKRVENLGTEYLGGKTLFIQSASLHGPFESKWISPWAKVSSGHSTEDIRRLPKARHNRAESRQRSGSVVDGREGPEYSRPGYRFIQSPGAAGFHEPAKKRRKYDEFDQNAASRQALPDQQETWLKANLAALSTSGDDVRTSTPTPAAREREKPAARTPEPRKSHSVRATSPRGHRSSPHQQNAKYLQQQGFTPNNEARTFGKRKDGPLSPSQAARQIDDVLCEAQEKRDKQFGTKDETRPTQSSSVNTSPLHQIRRESSKTLAPYVSTVVEQASSGKLAPKYANRSPRPSPHVVPPSTSLPEFHYRFARNGSASTSDRSGALFVDAPEEHIKRERSRSSSSVSSSGSSAFAEALNAAQAKAASAAQTSSAPSSTPVVDPEIKRLSFTASGKPAVRVSRPSSRSGERSIDPALRNGNNRKRGKRTSFSKQSSKLSDEPTSLSKQSSRLSNKPVTNSNHSKENLPEAQIVPDASVRFVPSGPSTNLLETEKQLPKLPDFDEDDSYATLSTQAAVLKAQKSFQNDVLGTLDDSVEKMKPKSTGTVAMQNGDTNTTPTTKDNRQRAGRRHSQAVKVEIASEQRMSTQTMINDMSPFAITTIKKQPPQRGLKKRASFAPSPTKTRKKHLEPSSLPLAASPGTPPTAHSYHERSMSTSSDRSPSPPSQELVRSRAGLSRQTSVAKSPSSGLTSFSILPNGTFRETQMGQDGQLAQAQKPPPPTFPEQDWPDGGVSLPPHPWESLPTGDAVVEDIIGGQQPSNSLRDKANDIEVAIEEAGSFLGEWDVEAEARKQSGSRSSTGTKNVLASGIKSAINARK